MTRIRAIPGRAAWVASILAFAACDNGLSPYELAHGAPGVTRISIQIGTSGVSLDPNGYVVTLRGGQSDLTQHVGLTADVQADRFPGTYTVAVTDVSPNCAAAGGLERTVTVTGETSPVYALFDVRCAHADGVLTVYTNFPDLPNGPFSVTLGDLRPAAVERPIGTVDSTRFTDLADGTYGVSLWASGCWDPIGGAEVSVSGGSGTVTLSRDSVHGC